MNKDNESAKQAEKMVDTPTLERVHRNCIGWEQPKSRSALIRAVTRQLNTLEIPLTFKIKIEGMN